MQAKVIANYKNIRKISSYLPLLQAAACRCSSPNQELHHSSRKWEAQIQVTFEQERHQTQAPFPSEAAAFLPFSGNSLKDKDEIARISSSQTCFAALNGCSCLPPGTQGELGVIFMPLPRAPWFTLDGSLYSLHDWGPLFQRSLIPSMSFTISLQEKPWRWVLLLQWLDS